MPKLTIGAAARTVIDRTTFNMLPAGRRALILYLASGDAWMGWNADVDSSGASTAGIPLPSGQALTMGAHGLCLDAPLYLYSAAGAVVHYQELIAP